VRNSFLASGISAHKSVIMRIATDVRLCWSRSVSVGRIAVWSPAINYTIQNTSRFR